ncbi:gliding motility-associated protein GldE [Flavobacterium sp. RHBU_24]|uniref:gliding motility-associated protein GldE n=1 Tax=Flavobacterium sp. RHBU_24 TaxID=3391185 RepID=UPI003984D698
MDDPGPTSIVSIDYSLIAGFAGIVFLLFCSAVISGTEVALFSLNAEDLGKINSTAPKKGNILITLLEKPKKLLATIVITNTFINLAIILFFFRMHCFSGIPLLWLRFSIEVAMVTFLILLFGEVIPKVYATRNHRMLAQRVAWPLYILSKILSPVSIPMREITLWINKKFEVQRPDFSINRLSQALELTDYGHADEEEQKILEGIVTFGNTEARQVMSPRIDMFSIDIAETFEEIMPKIIGAGFSRIPVYKESIDAIQGVLFVKDLIPHIGTTAFAWQEILREPFFIPENKKLDDLLKEFQGMKNHLAIVVDEYGGTSGIISLEDILEEIVGDISDEFDDDNIKYSQIDNYNYLFDGKIGLKDFYRITGVDETAFIQTSSEAETLAGFLLEINGNFPEKGQKINFNGNIFTVESVDKRRIKQIKVTLHETEA